MRWSRMRGGAVRRTVLMLWAVAFAGCAVPGPEPGPFPAPAPPPATTPGVTPPSAGVTPKLAGSSWYWLGSFTPAGLSAPGDPGNYNLEFLDGGQLAAQVACNSGGASWRQSGRNLSIGALKLSRTLCPGGSEGERFSRQLALVRSAGVITGLLELNMGDAGSMLFSRDPDWRLRNFDCPTGSPLLVAFGAEEAVVRWRGESWRLPKQATTSGVRYAGGNTILFSRGAEASLVNEGRQVAGPCRAKR